MVLGDKPGRKVVKTPKAKRTVKGQGDDVHPSAAPQKVPLKVRAISLGYYGAQLRQVGDKFDLSDQTHFSKSWMEKV